MGILYQENPMSIVLNGKKIATPGLETVSWLDDPKVPRATDLSPRTMWIRAIVMHTVHGKIGPLLPGGKPSTRAEAYAKYQANTSRDVSWDYTIDTDGTIVVSNDPILKFTWHANAVNPFTIGIELIQDDNGALYESQIVTTVRFLDTLTRLLTDYNHPIQRQIPITSSNTLSQAVRGTIPRIVDPEKAKSVVGIYGHRNQNSQKGAGDPNDYIFNYLLQASYKGFRLDQDEDLTFWKGIQAQYPGLTVDGVPGRNTWKALLNAGYPHGLITPRPGD